MNQYQRRAEAAGTRNFDDIESQNQRVMTDTISYALAVDGAEDHKLAEAFLEEHRPIHLSERLQAVADGANESITTEENKHNSLTARALQAMFTANTGKSFLDSGGAYGRNYERKQEDDSWIFDDVFELDAKYGDLEVIIHAYPWLLERNELYFQPALTELFWQWAQTGEQSSKHWVESAKEWAAAHSHQSRKRFDYRSGTVNTYNSEFPLDQTLQWTEYHCERSGAAYLMLQVHGGCDVRGGYTRPWIFQIREEMALHDQGYVTDGQNSWTTDCGGYYWYIQDYGTDDVKQLDELPIFTEGELLEELTIYMGEHDMDFPDRRAEELYDELETLREHKYSGQFKREQAYAQDKGGALLQQHRKNAAAIEERCFEIEARLAVKFQALYVTEDEDGEQLIVSPFTETALEIW